jgi:hypothetical protein
MALLTAHFDVSGVSFLIIKDKKNTEFFNFPYVYSKGTLSNQCTKKQFYSRLIEKVLSDRDIKISTCDILTCGFSDTPELELKTKYSVELFDLIENTEGFIPVFINNHSFITKGVVNTQNLIKEEDNSSVNDFGEYDQIANLEAYPQTIPDDLSSQVSLDAKLCENIPNSLRFESGRKIVFTGGRFSQGIIDKELNYILILEILRGLGVFDVYLDTSNSFALTRTMQMYDRSLVPNIQDYFENTGLFIRTGGACECLLSTGSENDKFIEIEENKVFVLPLNLENSARLSLKSRELGTIDVHTNGGVVGLVFDTRLAGESIYSDVRLLNDSIKQFEDTLKG